MEAMFNAFTAWLKQSWDWFWDGFIDLIEQAWEFILGAFWAFLEFVLGIALWLLEAIPVPDWFNPSSVQTVLNALPAGMWWGLDALEIPFGLGVILTAFAVRFFIRRVPIFG